MIPVTHFVYLGMGLLLLGLSGAAWRRDEGARAFALVASLWGLAVIAAAYARWWGRPDFQVMAMVLIAASLLQLVVLSALARALPAASRWLDGGALGLAASPQGLALPDSGAAQARVESTGATPTGAAPTGATRAAPAPNLAGGE